MNATDQQQEVILLASRYRRKDNHYEYQRDKRCRWQDVGDNLIDAIYNYNEKRVSNECVKDICRIVERRWRIFTGDASPEHTGEFSEIFDTYKDYYRKLEKQYGNRI